LRLDRDKLIRAREMLGYGIEKTAEEARVSKNSVLRAEHEEDIRPVTARKIAGALEVEVRDLLPLVEAPPDADLAGLGIPELKRIAKGLWAEWRERAAYDRVSRSYSIEDAEHLVEIQRRLTAVTNRIQDLDPPLATIIQRLEEPTEIIYHREPTPDERARLRAEYPDAVEVEDREPVLVW
jgi:transcriptional regulator with XRE-family HTH domain